MNLNIFKKIGKSIQIRHSMNNLQQDLTKVEDTFSQLLNNAENKDFIYLFNILYGCLNNYLIEKNYRFDFPILYVENLVGKKEIDYFRIRWNTIVVKNIERNIFNKEKIVLEIWNDDFWLKKDGFIIKKGNTSSKKISFPQIIETISSTQFQFMKMFNFYDILNKITLDSAREDEIEELLNMTKNKNFNNLLICFSPPQTKFKILNILHRNYNLNSINIENDIQLMKEISNEWEKYDCGRYEEIRTIKRILNGIPIEQIKEEINRFLFKEELLKDLNQLKNCPVNKIQTRKI